MESIGISGVSGFIGSRLAKRLGQFKRLDRSGIYPNCDFIYDFAGYGNLASQKNDPSEIYQANLMRIITASKHLGIGKLLYISTSSVSLPVQTNYSLSKKAAEEYLRNTGLKVAICRPYTIIGTGEHEEHLIPKLIDSCLNGTKMSFVSDPVHDFLDVEDFVDALLIIKDKGLFGGEIYEVGSGHSLSNDTIRQLVEGTIGKKANLEYVKSMRAYDTKDWRANTERIYSLGWEAKKSIQQTIIEMVNHAKKNS